MIGVYFSGTGNTKHCVTKLVNGMNKCAPIYALESDQTLQAISESETIFFGYPVYYSNLPKIVKEFIVCNKSAFQGKKIFIVATMGLFSGDGAGCSARLFKKFGATILGGLHIKMPDCIGDVKMLKKSAEQNRAIIAEADKKLSDSINKIKNENYPKEGLNVFYHMAGLLGQRLYFQGKTKHWFKKIKVDTKKCIGCGLCTKLCPMNNISLSDKKIVFNGKCTMCYRCFSHCPARALTILGKEVIEQCSYDNYANKK